MLDGVFITELKHMEHPKGDIFHALKSSEASFETFGEAYFSSIIYKEIKGWKKHNIMSMNLIVPVGYIKFVLYDDRNTSLTMGHFYTVTLSINNYVRLTIPPGIWVAFQGASDGTNLLLNIASIEHDPTESETVALDNIVYDWNKNE